MAIEPSRTTIPGAQPDPPSARTVLLTGLAIAAGTLAAAVVLPTWLPELTTSLTGTEPKAYWYLSRASGLVAFALLWLSMVWGLLMTSHLARRWPGPLLANEVHQHVSLLGLGLGLFHALILLGDRYAGYRLSQLLMPFAAGTYKPVWIGLGQLGFYMLALVALSFYVRRQIGNRVWKAVHLLSFGVYVSVLIHAVMSGTDTSVPWIQAGYAMSAAVLIFLTTYRLLVALFGSPRAAPRESKA
jgi:predicted ferric reductase